MATQNIGFQLDFTKGTHHNTFIRDGKLQLEPNEIKSYLNREVHAKIGAWESEVIDLVDNFKSLENLPSSSILVPKLSTFEVFTRTSDDGIEWEDYILMNMITSKINSSMRRFIQVRVEFFGAGEKTIDAVEEFNENSADNYVPNEFISYNGKLSLNKDYRYELMVDSSWSDQGYIVRNLINRRDYKRFDTITIY